MNSGALRRVLFALIGLLLVADAAAIGVVTHDEPAFDGAPTNLAAVLPGLMRYVEGQRGLRFEHTVQVARLTAAHFDEGDQPSGKVLQAYLEEESAFYRALGLLPATSAPVDLRPAANQERIAGVYNPGTNKLYVRDVEPSPFVDEVLVHELTHALDDQHFDLLREDLYAHDDESGEAFRALTEGDARWVEQQYVKSLSAADQESARQGRVGVGNSGPHLPDAFESLLSFPYSAGANFVNTLHDGGGADAVDDAFRNPPRTTAEILEPERYVRHTPVVAVARPKPEGESFRRGNLGELYVYLMVSATSSSDAARDAAHAWAGDRYVAYAAHGKACVLATVAARGGTVAVLVGAFTQWASKLPDAHVEATTDAVRIRSCVAQKV